MLNHVCVLSLLNMTDYCSWVCVCVSARNNRNHVRSKISAVISEVSVAPLGLYFN